MEDAFREYLERYTEFTNQYNRELYGANKSRGDLQPPVEPEVGRFLAFLVKLTGAKRVLELGCGVANSTIWLAQALKEQGGRLWTVDKHPRTWAEAVRNVENAGLAPCVEMIHADAEEAVKKLRADAIEFDMIFQDCGKYLYTLIYEDVFALLRKGGVIAADDTMFQACGGVRKNLGLHMDRYNRQVFDDGRFFSTMLPIGHGVTLSFKL